MKITTIIEILKWVGIGIGTFGGLAKLIEMIGAHFEPRRQKKAYLQYIAQKFEFIDFPKTGSLVPLLPLGKIYVRTRVKKYNPHRPEKLRWLPDKLQENIKSNDDFVSIFKVLYTKSKNKKKPLKLLILGSVDSGKTTLMKWLALQCTLCKKLFFFSPRFIPVYISLDEPGLDLVNIHRENSFVDLVEKRLKEVGLKSSFFDKEFRKGRVLFLFDGLDRRDDEKCHQMIQWIQLQGIGRNVLLISARKTGPDDAGILDFAPPAPIYTVQNFNKKDSQRFLKKWYYTAKRKIAEADGEKNLKPAKKEAREKYQYLENIIKYNNNSIFQLLAENPLCLTTMALVLLNRDRLPAKIHELFQESFRVIFKLMANEHFPANNTSVKRVMECLSKIATLMLFKNCMEMSLTEIQDILNEDRLSSLLDKAVLKTGLLYKVQDSYGFTHATFQQYLVAWHFAMFSDYTHLLEFRNDDNWAEVFKFFVNMSEENVTRQFFNEIIQGLFEKQYWPRMLIWTNCLLYIADKNLQNEIEIQFARQVLRILSRVKYKKKAHQDNEKFIIYLYISYPHFKHARQFKSKAWKFFTHAKHPLVQTFGSSILHDICRKDPDEALKFVTALKDRISELEKQDNLKQDKLFDFLYRNHNSISLIIALRMNLLDFTYALEKLKSPHPFIKYLFLVNFCNFLDILNTFELMVVPELKEAFTFLDAQRFFRDLNPLVNLDFWAVRDFMTLQGFVELQTSMNLAAVLTPPSQDVIPDALDRYDAEFREKLKDVQITTEIERWVNKAYKRLNSLPDKKLLEFFPGTTKEEIDQFRTVYMGLSDIERN